MLDLQVGQLGHRFSLQDEWIADEGCSKWHREELGAHGHRPASRQLQMRVVGQVREPSPTHWLKHEAALDSWADDLQLRVVLLASVLLALLTVLLVLAKAKGTWYVLGRDLNSRWNSLQRDGHSQVVIKDAGRLL